MTSTKDHNPLAQINMDLLFDEETGLPFYYHKLAGNISDVKKVKNLLADIDSLGFSKGKIVIDRVFYNQETSTPYFRII